MEASVAAQRPSAAVVALIPLLPLIASAVLLLTGRRWRGRSAGWLGSFVVAGSFVLSLLTLFSLLGNPAESRAFVTHLFDWMDVGLLRVGMDLRIDQLSMVMALSVTGVGAVIHFYSIEYMDGDPRYSRFFGYMNLFVFFMLVLVLADNFVLLYLGWEGVGLCSYLLIGFWFDRKSAADAAKKAFITTRIGDVAFLIGIIFIWLTFGSLDFDVVFRGAEGLANGTATVMALLLFAGAVGKSAQLPLHVWLPDAMEGPTPVSALIHAATMVTAGVYLVVRAHPIFEASTVALDVVAVVGILTAIYAGLAAVAQDDIKRMLAYSTMSQLGFMFFGAGLGAYTAAIFLLVAHAFFKALLFLGAGSVMHGLHEETDMMKMGALREAMPVTGATWLIGWLAMAGIWPLSGFFAKDQVIAAASHGGRTGLWIAALVGALLTAIYISRATFMTFFGSRRTETEPHDPPQLMRVVLIILAVASALGGVLGFSATAGPLPTFLEPVVGEPSEVHAGPSEFVLGVISTAIALAGIGLAFFIYLSGRIDWQALRVRLAGPKRALERALFVNDFYSGGLVAPGKLGAAFAAYVVDVRFIDGAIGGLGRAFAGIASLARGIQTGFVRTYAVGLLLGAVGILWYLAVRF
ncbi:MAG: NADH-quinone oxidoreductase subunit L [Actinomycetota bacterium]|nr:NADH-quinone oxidoreductase subunit L [Actinomycetota bacterium]